MMTLYVNKQTKLKGKTMNERLKYRVWYKPYNGYVEKRDHLVLLPEGVLCEYDGIEIESDNYVIEQSTGLKDKNGNLIYEGDVVKCENTTGVVKFGLYRRTDEHFPDSIYGFYIEWEKQCSFRQDFGYWTTEERIEIIGNVHENKGN